MLSMVDSTSTRTNKSSTICNTVDHEHRCVLNHRVLVLSTVDSSIIYHNCACCVLVLSG